MNEKTSRGLHYGILTCIAAVFLVPLLWVVVASFDANAGEAIKLPARWTMDNYQAVLFNRSNLRGFFIGLLISGVQAVVVVVLSGLAAYPLSRYHLSYEKGFLYGILFMTALPMTAVIVPVYKLYLSAGLYDNIWGVTLFFSASSLPYGIWLMKNFMDGVPGELEEAARVDGATTWQAMRRIIAPLMLPGICVVFIYTFSGSWGNFFIPYILLSTPGKLPASVQLYQFFGNHGMVAYGQLAAYSALYTLPSILLYVLAQGHMSKGFTMAGAAKG